MLSLEGCSPISDVLVAAWRRACLLCLARLWGSNRIACGVGCLGRLACPDGALLQQVGRVLPAHRHHAGRQRCMHPCTATGDMSAIAPSPA